LNFARENDLRLVVKGGGHSYQGTSNAPDSLLIWTRHMNDIAMHTAFVPQGCEHTLQPQPAVTVGAGTIGMQAYDAVYDQAWKIRSGWRMYDGMPGGSGSKRLLWKLLEALRHGRWELARSRSSHCRRPDSRRERMHPDLFWALKGGGGGSFGVVSKMTLRVHDLPEFFGSANFTIKAASDDAYRRLIREFVSFYRENLFNDHWGEQVHVKPDNTLDIRMGCHGLDTEQAKKAWQPFLDWVARSPDSYSVGRVVIGSIPARRWWDVQWWKEHWPEIAFPREGLLHGLLDDVLVHVMQPVLDFDSRPGAGSNNAWWKGDGEQVAQFLWGYESLWLPASLLENDAQQQRLADALFASSRYLGVGLHFNKGLAGAPPDAIAGAKDTAMNPAVLTAFALAIAAAGQGPAYPGIPGHEPSVVKGRIAAERVDRCMDQLRAVAGEAGAYVSESSYFEQGWQQSYWGSNYPRLAEIKRKYDPDGLFFVHNGVGSEQWSADGFTKL